MAEEPLRRRLRARALGLASRASGVVPRPAALGGLQGLAWLSRFTRFEERTRRNLELALGDERSEEELARIAAGVRTHTARLAYEWLRLASMRDEDELHHFLDGTVEVDGSIAMLEQVLDGGRGALLVTAHLGNWELLAAAVRRQGIEGAVVGLEKHRDPTARWLVDLRRRYGVETIPQHSHPRQLVRALEGGRVLGVLCDLEVRRLAGEFLPFFGRPALTMTAPAALARARRVPLVPVRCVLPEPGAPRYRVLFEPPLEYDLQIPRREATRSLMLRVNELFEGWIRETPEQWAWHQHRWRTAPGGVTATPLHGRV